MTALAKTKYTVQEYIELDKNSEERFEFFNGEVFAIGGSPNHARICGNAYAALQEKLRGGPCEAFTSEMRIKVPKALPYRYPDASLVCGEPIFDAIEGQQMLVNPVLLVEVLSPSTALYDLKEKFSAYQSIISFQEYLLISQDAPHVIQYVKQEKRKWLRIETEGLENEVALASVNLTLSLSRIYERVKFPVGDPDLGWVRPVGSAVRGV